MARATAEILRTFHDRKSINRNNEEKQQRAKGTFISLQASQVVRGEVGNSEKIVVSSFELAHSNTPSVVFIDEFEALFTERGGPGSGRLATTLLQCMDEITSWRNTEMKVASSPHDNQEVEEDKEESRVVVLGATNTPWLIDTAFLRPGRFDRVVHVGLPNLDERKSILKVHMSRMLIYCPPGDDMKQSVENLCHVLATKCEGFSGADLEALCRAAAVRCLSERQINEQQKNMHSSVGNNSCFFKDIDSLLVTESHFMEARKQDVSRSTNQELVDKLMKWSA